MKKFPRFLKTMPQVYGLSFFDISGLIVSLYIAMIFKFAPLMTLLISVGAIAILKILKKNFDFTGFITPSIKKIDLTSFKGDQK